MPKKVIILIDGQNLYHSLRSMGIIEADIDFSKLLEAVLEKDDELIRTYWFRPEKIHESYIDRKKIAQSIIEVKKLTHLSIAADGTIPAEILAEVETEFQDVTKWFSAEKQRFSQVDYKYSLIEGEYSDLEIYRTGVLKLNPYRKERLGEKGVDVALATKMVEFVLSNRCDKIILFSGDFDYAEALRIVKNNMKKVHLVKLFNGTPPKNINMSTRLSQIADKVVPIYEAQIRNEFKRARPASGASTPSSTPGSKP